MPAPACRRLRGELLIALPLGILFAFTLSQGIVPGADPHHDGFLLKPALDVAGGKRLFAETFTMYGPLTTWLQAGALMLAPDAGALYVIRLATAAAYLLAFAVAWLLWRQVLPPGWVGATCLLTALMAPFYLWGFNSWSSVFALPLQLATACLLLAWLQHRHGLLPVAAGLAAALTFWCRQSVGIVLSAAAFITIAGWRYQRAVTRQEALAAACRFGAGAAAGLALVLALLAATGALTAWWQQNMLFVIAWRAVVAGGSDLLPRLLQSLLPALHPQYTFITPVWSLLPLCCLLLAGYAVCTGRRTPDSTTAAGEPSPPVILLLAVFALASWHQYYPQTCIRHVYWAAVPMFGVVVLALRLLARRLTPSGTLHFLLPAVVLLLFFAPDCVQRLTTLAERRQAARYRVDSPLLRGLCFTAPEAAYFRQVEDIIRDLRREYPGRPLLNLTPDPLYACYEPRNAQPACLDFSWLGAEPYPGHGARNLAFIRTVQPVIVGTPQFPPLPAGYRRLATLHSPHDHPSVPVNRSLVFLVPVIRP